MALKRRRSDLGAVRCSFQNLPEQSRERWGEGLTAEEIKKCRWLKPALVATIEFLEWTDKALRHPKFIALRDDRSPLGGSARLMVPR
ncbi:MAG: hypothetical protein JO121_17510 [Deltaproteobacteria bacterium]|nr:hypothetical protein [Deltaproteobacteria bacterium]